MLNPIPCILWPLFVAGATAAYLVGRKWPRPNSSSILVLLFLGVFLIVAAILLAQLGWELMVIPYIPQ